MTFCLEDELPWHPKEGLFLVSIRVPLDRGPACPMSISAFRDRLKKSDARKMCAELSSLKARLAIQSWQDDQ
jgi:hypothetical protein